MSDQIATFNLEKYLNGIPEDQRATARDLLSKPENLKSYIEAHTGANDEAKTFRHALKSLQAATGIELTNAEMVEVSKRIGEIFADGEFNPEVYAEIVSDYGGIELIRSGEIDPEELGLIEDSETGELMPIALADLKRHHQETVQVFRQKWEGLAERWGIRYFGIHTGMSYVDVLLSMAV